MANNADDIFDQLLKSGPPVTSSPVPPSPVEEQPGMLSQSFQNASNLIDRYNPFTGQDFAEMGGEMATAAAVAPVLQKVPNPLVRGAGYALAAGVGTAGGQTLYKIGKDEPLDHGELLTSAALSAGFSGAGDAIFAAGARIVNKIRQGKPLTEAEMAELKATNEVLQNSRIKIVETGSGFEVKEFGPHEKIPENAIDVTLRPDQIVGGFESLKAKIGKSSIRGEAKFEAFEEAQNKAYQQIWEQTELAFGGQDQVLFGGMVKAAREQVKDATVDITEPMFKRIDELAKDTYIDMTSVYKGAEEMLRSAGSNMKQNFKTLKDGTTVFRYKGQEYKMTTNLVAEVDGVVKNLANRMDTSVTFTDVMKDIQAVTNVIDLLPKGSGPRRQLEEVRNGIYEALDSQASKLGNEVIDEWRVAKELYRNGMEGVMGEGYFDIGDKILLSALEGNANGVAKQLIDEGEVGVRALNNFLDNAQRHLDELNKYNLYNDLPPIQADLILDNFKGAYMYHTWNELATKGVDPKASVLEQFNRALGKETGGDANVRNVAKEIFTTEEFGKFRQLLAVGARLEKIMAGNFSLMVRGQQSAGLREAGADVVDIATGQGTVSSILGGALHVMKYLVPEILAKSATDPKRSQQILSSMNELHSSQKSGKWGAQDWSRMAVILGDNLTSEQEEIVNEQFGFTGELDPHLAMELMSVLADEEAAIKPTQPVIPR